MKPTDLRRTVLASLIAALSMGARAEEIDPDRLPAIQALTSAGGELDLGLVVVTSEARRVGQYTGVVDEGAPLLNLKYRALDASAGRWLRLNLRDLGMDTREADFDHSVQGKWRYSLGLAQTIRHEPLVVHTGLTGIGSAAQTVNKADDPVHGRDVELKMRRDQLTIGTEYSLGPATARLRFTHEKKEGARIYGRGNFGTPAAIEFLTEPIDRTTQTLDALLAHSGTRFQVSGGYYLTRFDNHVDRLDVASSLPNNALTAPANAIPPWSTMSMPLSNNAHQLYLNGGVNLGLTTRVGLKASKTVARQDENLISVVQPATPAAPVAPASLDAKVVTTLGYVDLTSAPFDVVDVQASVRYEDRDDQTPIHQYLNLAAANLVTGENKPRSWRSLRLLGEAGVRLPAGLRLIGTVERDDQERNYPEPYRRVAFRKETTEDIGRLEVRRTVAESVTGSVAYGEARRRGSPLGDVNDTVASTVSNGVVTAIKSSGDVNPLIWADRDRSTWRMNVDWSALDNLNLNASGEKANDVYSGRELGPRDGKREYLSLSAHYTLSRRWNATAFWSRDDTRARQGTHTGIGPTQIWTADLRQLSDQAGVGLRGNFRSGVEVGGDLGYHRDRLETRQRERFDMVVTELFNPAATSPPDIVYRYTEIQLFANMPLDQRASVRLDYRYRDFRTDDWTWNGWVYSDGTTLIETPRQRTHLLAVSYRYRWW